MLPVTTQKCFIFKQISQLWFRREVKPYHVLTSFPREILQHTFTQAVTDQIYSSPATHP